MALSSRFTVDSLKKVERGGLCFGAEDAQQCLAQAAQSEHVSYSPEELKAIHVSVGLMPGDRRVISSVSSTSGSSNCRPTVATAGADRKEDHQAVIVRDFPSTDRKCTLCGACADLRCNLCGRAYCSEQCQAKDGRAHGQSCDQSTSAPAQGTPAEDKGPPAGPSRPLRRVQARAGPTVGYVPERTLPGPDCPMVPVSATSDVLYLHQESLLPDLQKLGEALNDWVINQCKVTYFRYTKGDYVSALYSKDSTWYRGQVTKECPDGKLTVFFLDYGNSEEMGEESLRPLPMHVGLIPRLAFGVVPQGGVTAHLLSLLKGEQSVRVIQLGTAAARSPPVVRLERLDGTCLSGPVQDDQKERSSSCSREPVQIKEGQLPKGAFKATMVAREGNCVYLRTIPGSDKLASLKAELEAHCATSGAPEEVLVGDAVCAPGEDQGWYRGTITAVAGDLCKVLLVDCGTVEVVRKQELRLLLPDLASCLPSLAVKACLDGVVGRLTDSLLRPLMGQEVTARVTGKRASGQPPNVVAFDSSGASVNSVLRPLAIKRGAAFDERPLPSGRFRVKVSHVTDLGQLFYLQQHRLLPALEMLMEELNSEEPSALKQSRLFLGAAVCARHPGDGRWHRAVVVATPDEEEKAEEKKEEDEYSLRFIDYGYTEMVPVHGIRALPECMKDIPSFSVCVGLKGVRSVSKGCKLDMLNLDYDAEIVDQERLPYQVKLFVRGRCVNRFVH